MSTLAFRLGLALAGAGVGSYCVAAIAIAPGADLSRHVAWYLVAFAFYLVAVGLVLRQSGPGGFSREARVASARTSIGNKWDLVIVLGFALLFRAALLVTNPSLSDDVFRYVWDGKLINAGLDPHLHPPSAQELAHLRGTLWEGINHKSMVTPYPPLAEALFASVYRVAPESLKAMQVAAVLLDLGVLTLLLFMLVKAGLDVRRVLVYAWNPLVLVQFAHSAHYDAAMTLPLLAAIYLLSMGKRWVSGLLLGVSVLVKIVPAAVAPLFIPLWGFPGLAAAGVVVGMGIYPWLSGGVGLSGLLSEASDARFNDSLGYLLYKLLGLVVADPDEASRGVAAAALFASAVSAAFLIWRHRAGWKGLLQAVYWILGLFLLLNAVVEPWYLTWMVPFLCFFLASGSNGWPHLGLASGWLLMSGSVVLTDLTYLPQYGSSLWIWVRVAEYGPLYALISLSAYRWIKSSQARAVAS